MISFNIPYLSGKENKFISKVYTYNRYSGNGFFSKKCMQYFTAKFGLKHPFITNSCTSALELAALVLNIEPGDEIIMPSYTFVTTANAFANKGAKIVFADSKPDNPNIDENKIEALITPKTKAIVVVHYAGIACNMDNILAIANKYNIRVIEDAAQAIGAFYLNATSQKIPLGGLGDVGCFSFHETKNIQCGEGGLFVLNNTAYLNNALYAWDKGTNRIEFNQGKINAYTWVSRGSSFYPSEISAAFLYAQLFDLDKVIKKRVELWNIYYSSLSGYEAHFTVPALPAYAIHNGHIFYIVTKNIDERRKLMNFLSKHNIQAIFHYQCLHKSPYYISTHKQQITLLNSEKFTDCLLRLPLYYKLKKSQILYICNKIKEFYSVL